MHKIVNVMHNNIMSLNSSKFFAGILMLVVNIGSRYVTIQFSKSQEEYIKNLLLREFLIFSIVWMATRDIMLTASFVILADYILNENSTYCCIPNKYKHINKILANNNDSIISPMEIKAAEELLKKAKQQEEKTNQLNMMSYMKTGI
jgi:hypothetical protein